MYFIGDFKYPRKFSRFIRFCLYVGIGAGFINPKSPWMNGSIENFNGWFEEKFWEKETFTSREDMRAKSTHFVGQYNDLSTWKNRNKPLERIKRKLEVYYRAKDQDTPVLIKEFEYGLNEVVIPLRQDIWKT
ncbi:MAG: integrase core domain-containing protein [Halobacteriota archaeon]